MKGYLAGKVYETLLQRGPMTSQEMGRRLNVAREVAGKALSRLKMQGWVEQTDRRKWVPLTTAKVPEDRRGKHGEQPGRQAPPPKQPEMLLAQCWEPPAEIRALFQLHTPCRVVKFTAVGLARPKNG